MEIDQTLQSKGLSGIRDVDLQILTNLNDHDLFNICQIKNKYINSLCNNESFWRNKFIKKYGEQFKSEGRIWKDFYLKLVYYDDKYLPARAIERILRKARLPLDWDLIYYYIDYAKKNIKDRLENRLFNLSIIDGLLINNRLSEEEKISFIKYLSEQTDNLPLFLTDMLRTSAVFGDEFFFNYFRKQMEDQDIVIHWNRSLYDALKGGNKNIINQILERVNPNIRHILGAAVGHNLEIIKQLEKLPMNELQKIKFLNDGLIGAVIGGHMDLINYFIDKGADNWNRTLFAAIVSNRKDLIQYFIDKGANDWNRALDAAKASGYKDLIRFFENKIAEEK